MKFIRSILILAILALLLPAGNILAAGESGLDRYHSTTGPEPPPGVQPPRTDYDRTAIVGEVEVDITPYNWRHGCGPTAVGMVVGYYDSHGFPELIPGETDTQTAAVNQAIASGGEINSPQPPGHEGNCEDYCLPKDSSTPNILDDAYITAHRTPHTDNCIADYMHTSRSTDNMRYGWSTGGRISPSFKDYVRSRCPSYRPTSHSYNWNEANNWDDKWDTLRSEIDHNHPMVFLVDINGDDDTDHFVTIVGYRLRDGLREYGCKDTWNDTTRWERFRRISSAYKWGICCAYIYRIENGDGDGKWYVDYGTSSPIQIGNQGHPYNSLTKAICAASPGDTIYVKGGIIDEAINVEKKVTILKY